MIQEFVDIYTTYKGELREYFEQHHPESYKTLVEKVVQLLNNHHDGYGKPDPKRIHEIDDGEYQGTLVYVIGDDSYQPAQYWYVRIAYGSCSVCDTLESIGNYDGHPPKPSQVNDYMTLCLHIIQQLNAMDGEEV